MKLVLLWVLVSGEVVVEGLVNIKVALLVMTVKLMVAKVKSKFEEVKVVAIVEAVIEVVVTVMVWMKLEMKASF